MSHNQSQSDASTVALGSRTNIFDSQSGEFDLDRDPGDPSKPEHDTNDADPEDRSVPSMDELLDRDRGHHDYQPGVNREKWIAGTLLRSLGNPSLYCPDCWHELDIEHELSDPEHHLPLVVVDHEFDTSTAEDSLEVSKNDHRRHRHCDECGCVTFGGVLADRPLPELLEVVDDVLDAVDEIVLSSRRGELKSQVRARKEQGMSDEANVAELVRDLRYDREQF